MWKTVNSLWIWLWIKQLTCTETLKELSLVNVTSSGTRYFTRTFGSTASDSPRRSVVDVDLVLCHTSVRRCLRLIQRT